MKTIDITKRAARSLRNAKTRTILTSLAIAVGAFTIAVSLAAGEGARQYADNLISSNVNPRALFIVKDSALFGAGPAQQASLREYDPDTGTTAGGMSIQQLTQADIDTLSARDDMDTVVATYSPTVKYVVFGDDDARFTAGVASYDSTIVTEAYKGDIPGIGQQIADDEVIVPESFVDTLVESDIIQSADDFIGMKVVMTADQSTVSPSVDEIAAAFAAGGQEAVAELVRPVSKDFTFTVRAVSKKSSMALTTTTDMQISPVAARAISEYVTAGTDNYQKYVGATALVKEGRDPQVVKEALVDDEFYAQTAKDLQGVIFTVVNTLQGIVLGFGVVALIASVFGIINTQYISVLERTREIGLMKALGMRGRSVSRLFQFEAAWIGFLGGVIGSLVAVGAGALLNPWITSTLELGEGNYLLIFQPVPIILMVIALILIAMLAGWFPARKAAKLDPIQALRTE